jgi:hypothetical protein
VELCVIVGKASGLIGYTVKTQRFCAVMVRSFPESDLKQGNAACARLGANA